MQKRSQGNDKGDIRHMSLKDKTYRLYDYISQVYAIDLPVDRNVTGYGAELWWQADIVPSPQCKIKEFDSGNNNARPEAQAELLGVDAWLSVTKRSYDNPPELPSILKEWVNLSPNPTQIPSPKPSILKSIAFTADSRRTTAFDDYIKSWKKWKEFDNNPKPAMPEILVGWIDTTQPNNLPPIYKANREFEERFGDDKARLTAYDTYIKNQWELWAKRVLPLYKANILYDQLFSLHQRLSVEGDRIEIIWGHLFLAWNYRVDSINETIYHPLFLTNINLNFDPERRNITLSPSLTIPTKLDLECLLNLDYSLKDELIKFVRKINNGEFPPDIWDNNQMHGLAATITGYLSTEPAEKTNLYLDNPVSHPAIDLYPTVFNSPIIFVRKRSSRLWIDDAKKIAESIHNGALIPPFIRSLIADPHTNELPNPEEYIDSDTIGKNNEDGELLLPLEYNDQQREIVEKLRGHFGVLVQGPPGTGKSHTIANIISSLLARGKRILVTSQTENALKVLRDYIPDEIRSLCVSQLGNDIESKIQLNQAVDSIGKRLAEKGSRSIELKIQFLRKEIRSIREEQATLRNQIKEWVELDACKINIDGGDISAHQAAKECSENKSSCAWFPDKFIPETEPPLNNDELLELCQLIHTISDADRISCLKYRPDPKQLATPEVFSQEISRRQSYDSLSIETEKLRLDWGKKLISAQLNDIEDAISLLNEGLSALQELGQSWQFNVLDLMVAEKNQDVFWQNFLTECTSNQNKAWEVYQLTQRYEISASALPLDIDINAALEELSRILENGKNPLNWLTRLGLSKSSKLLFDSIRIDGHNLITLERISIVKAHFSYKLSLKKIQTIWNQVISAVNGPELDITAAMPLVNIDAHIKQVHCTTEWKSQHFEKIRNLLLSLGCPNKKYLLHKEADLKKCLKILHGQLAVIKKQKIDQGFATWHNDFISESQKEEAHAIWKQLAKAVENQSTEIYEQAYKEALRLSLLEKEVQRLEYLSNKLKDVAPSWYEEIENKATETGAQALPEDWVIAWRWRRLNEWLYILHNRESVESLQNRLERARRKEHELIIQLVTALTWQRQMENVQPHQYRALTAWADAMRKYGKGTGKQAQRYLTAAAKAMLDAVGAVPTWIMPLHRVIQSFPAKSDVFDVIITDESSQCDVRALTVLFRAKKVLIVGDPEQISPTGSFIDITKTSQLIQEIISDIPYPEIFSIKNSLYDIAKTIPRMDRTLLTEHFRCVPQIINFNNRLCPSYAGKLEPLRTPNPHEMLNPPIVAIFVENGFRGDNDINEPEAEALVEMLIKCCNDIRYASNGKNNRKRTMGVISLLGEKQAKYISELIAQCLSETEREERRIICGDAYSFQGDERDVMFLSLVVASNSKFSALTKDADRQRFNVATSRARDQVFLFHSVKLGDIKNSECVRYKLLDWYLNPPTHEIKSGIELLKQKADSDFEIEVGERIIKRGYKVIPQYHPFPNDFSYRIDLLIQGSKNRVAIECDGDRWHGPEKWEYDQRREAQLRRAGLKFWRINGSAFYLDKEKSLEGLWKFLETEGIENSFSSSQDTTQNIQKDEEASGKTQDNSDVNIKPNISDFKIDLPKQPAYNTPQSENFDTMKETIQIGDIVKVFDESRDKTFIYKIGWPHKDKPGYVSPESPTGRKLLGCKLNDIIEIEVPGGVRILEVIDIASEN